MHSSASSTSGVECPICIDEVPRLLVWGEPPCSHACCESCCVRHLRLELAHPEPDRVACAVPGCGAAISADTLAAAAAWAPPAAAGGDLALRPLGADARARAEGRRAQAARAAALAAARAALPPGVEAHSCPFPPCAAVLVAEAPSWGDESGVADGVGRLALCSGCRGEVCSVCCAAWQFPDARHGSPRFPALGHSGLRCTDVRTRRAAAAASAAAASTFGGGGGGGTAEPGAAAVEAARNLGGLLGTVKQCPQCGVGVTHYRGHACHHIGVGRGCVGCVAVGFPHPKHWCYVCLGPWPCLNASANGCNTFCDATCDCPDCPDCQYGKPCANCSGRQGGCRVCSGEARSASANATWEEKGKAAVAEKMATGWGGPRATSGVVTAVAPTLEMQKEAEATTIAQQQQWGYDWLQDVERAVRALQRAGGAAAAVAAAVHALTVLMTRRAEVRTYVVLHMRGGAEVAAALERCREAATVADGDGAAPGSPPLALCETVLEFFEAAAAPAEVGDGFLGGDGGVEDGALRVGRLAEQGAFATLQAVFTAHASHAVIVRRTLGIMASAVRVAMAAGQEVPPGAEQAFDSVGGLTRLAALIRSAAVADDGVLLEAALRALAGVRLHTPLRVEQSRPLVPLLLAVLSGRPPPPLPPPPSPPKVVGGSAAGAAAATTAAAAAAFAVVAVTIAPANSTDIVVTIVPTVEAGGPPALLSVPAAAAAVVALCRVTEALHDAGWLTAELAAGSAAGAAEGRSGGGAKGRGGDGRHGGAGGAAVAQPSVVSALERAMANAVAEAVAGGAAAGVLPQERLPLWEAVVLASAVRRLQWRRSQAAMLPWRAYPPALGVLVRSLPPPPAGLVARGALLRFRPATLRVRLARGDALRGEVGAAAETAAAPLWLKVLVSPLALLYLAWRAFIWTLCQGLPLAIGYTLIGMDMACGAAQVAGGAAHDLVLAPVGRYVVFPIAKAAATAGRWVHRNMLAPVGGVATAAGGWLHREVLNPTRKKCHEAGSWLHRSVLAPTGRGMIAAGRWMGEEVLAPTGRGLCSAGRWVGKKVLAPTGKAVGVGASLLAFGVYPPKCSHLLEPGWGLYGLLYYPLLISTVGHTEMVCKLLYGPEDVKAQGNRARWGFGFGVLWLLWYALRVLWYLVGKVAKCAVLGMRFVWGGAEWLWVNTLFPVVAVAAVGVAAAAKVVGAAAGAVVQSVGAVVRAVGGLLGGR